MNWKKKANFLKGEWEKTKFLEFQTETVNWEKSHFLEFQTKL